MQVYIDITYSKSRKNELKYKGQKDCPLLARLLTQILEKNNASNITTYIPKHNDRSADIVLEFKIAKDCIDVVVDKMTVYSGICNIETYLYS